MSLNKNLNTAELFEAIIKELNSSLQTDALMNIVYKSINELMAVSFFIICAYDETDKKVSVNYCVKQNKIVAEDFTTAISNPNSLIAHTIKSKNEIIIHNLQHDYGKYLKGFYQLHGKEDLHCESVIMIPLFVKQKLIGLFSVQHQNINTYSLENINFLRSLSPFIALALNNAYTFNLLSKANDEILIQKLEIENKQNEILSSIRYAKRIQQAMLPSEKFIDRNLKKHKQ